MFESEFDLRPTNPSGHNIASARGLSVLHCLGGDA